VSLSKDHVENISA